jgi:hypothetical protein
MPAHPLPPSHRASSFRVSAGYAGGCACSACWAWRAGAGAARRHAAAPDGAGHHHGHRRASVSRRRDSAAPADAAALPAWLARQRPAADVDLFGGAYWLLAQVRNDSSETPGSSTRTTP